MSEIEKSAFLMQLFSLEELKDLILSQEYSWEKVKVLAPKILEEEVEYCRLILASSLGIEMPEVTVDGHLTYFRFHLPVGVDMECANDIMTDCEWRSRDGLDLPFYFMRYEDEVD